MVASVGQKTQVMEGIKVTPKTQTSILERQDFNQLLKVSGGNMAHMMHAKQELTDYNTFTLAVPDSSIRPQPFK